MNRFVFGVMGFFLAACIAPAAAFGVEAPNGGEPTDEQKAAQAAEQIVDVGGSTATELESGGSVIISKTIEATGIEDYFDIALHVEMEEVAHDNSTAVVIVMDVSNTMNEVESDGTEADESDAGTASDAAASGSARLQNAQAAANEFIRQYCEGENLAEDRMLGLVIFNTNASWAEGLELQNVSATSVDALQASVNAIVAPATPAENRFTNMEAGLRLAYNVLDPLQVAYKYVIFVTDGFPTTYVNRSLDGNMESVSAIEGYSPYESDGYIATQVGEDGYFADAVLELPCSYGTSYSDKAAARAEDAANEMKADDADGIGINIFSVGIDIGGQTVQEYVDRATQTYSIVDRTSTEYVVGSADDPQAYREWLAQHIAGGPNMGQGVASYANGDNRAELMSAFDGILAGIRAVTGFPFIVAQVEDPMGRYIEFEYFFDVDGQGAAALTGDFSESDSGSPVENTAVFDEESNAIQWDLRQSGYALTERDDGSRVYGFDLRYRVRLMTEVEGFPFESALPTNDEAVLTFEETNEKGDSLGIGSLVFPDPSVRAFAEEPDDPEEPVVPDDPRPNPGDGVVGKPLGQTGDKTIDFALVCVLAAMAAVCAAVFAGVRARAKMI